MKFGQKIFFLVARVWVALAFIGMGIDIIMQWHEVTEAFVDQLQLIECVANGIHCKIIGWMYSSSSLFVGIGVAVFVVGGLLLLVGYRVRLASLLLLLLILLQVIFLHPFWLLEGAERGQAIAFLWGCVVNIGALLFCMGLAKKKLPKPPESSQTYPEPPSSTPLS